MCGIVGAYSFNNNNFKITEPYITKMRDTCDAMNNILNKIKHRILNKSFFQKNYKHFFESQYFPSEKLREIQTEKLKYIIEVAVTTVPYYMPLKREINFSQFTLDELKKFPIVTKDIIRAEPEKFISNKNKGFVSHTSGSTGKPFEFLNSYYSDAIENMAKFRAWGMGKDYIYKPKDPIIVLRSYAPKKNEPLYRIDKKNNYWYLSAFDINEKNLDLYLNIIKQSKARLLRGYASSIFIFTNLLIEKEIKLDQIKTLITSSETLLPAWRKTIESHWGFSVCDWYGLNERTVTVQQCWAGNYHNNDEYGLIELNKNHQIISTSLNNDAMPFIRYATKDIAIPLDQPEIICPCGRKLSVPFKGIEGRSDDILIKQDGTQIPTINLYTLMHDFKYIKQFKIIQNSNLSLNVFLVVKETITEIQLNDIKRQLLQRTGNLPISFNIVEKIERDIKTGKVQAIKSLVKHKPVLEVPYVHRTKPYHLSSQKAWKQVENGLTDILKLDWNEATIPPSPNVARKINETIAQNYLNWYPTLRNDELLSLLAEYTQLNKKNVQYFCGSDALHECILRTYLTVGDTTLIIYPTYDNFRVAAELMGAKIEYFYLNPQNYNINWKELENHIENTHPKLVYICNPNNPTGTSYSVGNLEKLIKLNKQTLFVIDEAYFEFLQITASPLVNHYHNLIITRTLSKAFALAGFRIGYCISSAENVEALSKIRNAKSVPMLSQIAAIEALKDKNYTNKYIEEVLACKKLFIKSLTNLKHYKLNVITGHGNYVLLRMQSKETAKALHSYLESKHIYIRDFSTMNSMESCLRITIGTEKQMKRVTNEIESFFDINE